ncbi:hypothetical protein TRFO_31022 [Tritrichomonas foetus]|uniref:Uncharacterized protein n=1 Tax=Tritrichomonas foetus TaxID=1144522 RepID=A0A1J4JSH6_9EUKA|nr:hypothetical protein TRFO_31022 [Tritrichomonas foetus]|eukprot:OHT02003.1 hypothetical protein TRFO_31022 [Tritrichomonas foetus]
MNFADPVADYDQQASILLEKSKGMQGGSQSLHFSALNASTSIVVDNIYSRINAIEEKLNTNDSIYRLATQANAASEKEKREQFQSFVDKAQSIEQTLSKVENKVSSLDMMIKNIVHQEMQQFNKSNEFTNNVNEAASKLTERINSIENQFLTGIKKSQKDMKKLKIEASLAKTQQQDDGRVDEIIAQLSEMKRRQSMMRELLSSLHGKGSPDYQNVSSQISQLFAQLSSKKVETPLKFKLNSI